MNMHGKWAWLIASLGSILFLVMGMNDALESEIEPRESVAFYDNLKGLVPDCADP